MSNKFEVLTCDLCGVPFGFNFNLNTEPTKENYCYNCGHAMLLLKAEFSFVDFDNIKSTTLEQDKQAKLNQDAVIYFLNKLIKNNKGK